MSEAPLWIVAPFADELAQAIGALPVPVRTAASFAEAGPDLAAVEALVAMGDGLSEARAGMPRLRWLQAVSAGVDHLAGIDLAGVAVTTAAGAHVAQMAEHAFLLLLALARDARRLLRQQDARQWQPWYAPTLAGGHALVVGTGRIAQGFALRARAFGLRVTGVSATPRAIEGFDAVIAREALAEAARGADHLVILAALSDETRGLVSRAVLEALPRHATLVNLGRGPLLDEAALAELLAAGRIAGAGLDVVATEPLPPESPLWTVPNLIVSPHVGGLATDLVARVAPIVRDNAERWYAHPRRELVNLQR